MYKTLEGFIDTVEKKSYAKDAEFKVGPKTDDARLKSLLGVNNAQGRALIVEVKKEVKKKGE